MPIDFDQIRRDHALPDVARASGLHLTEDGREFRALCPFHGEDTPSFTIWNGKRGWSFYCFGCGAGGDVVDYVRERYGVEQAEAIEIITGSRPKARPLEPRTPVDAASNPYEGYAVLRPPEEEPLFSAGRKTPSILNPKRLDPRTGLPTVVVYKPTLVHPYRSKTGQLLGYVLRIDLGDGKKITPGVWWMKNEAAGFEGWSHGSFPEPRPLYGLDALYADPDYQVLIVEGEKCKDAAARLLADKRIVPVSWMGGGKAIRKTYWKSLAGRSVVIWPDNDIEGWRSVLGYIDGHGRWKQGIYELLMEAGVSRIKIIHITPERRPDGWDIADAEAEGLGGEGVAMIMKAQIRLWTPDHFAEWRAQEIAKHEEPQHAPPQEQLAPPQAEAEPPHTNGFDHREAEPAFRDKHADISPEDWRHHLIWKADGDGIKATSIQNASLILQYDPTFAGIFAWNDFAKEVWLMKRPPWDVSGDLTRWQPRQITDPDITGTACWIEYCGMATKVTDIGRVIYRVAQHNSFNPVLEAMNRLQWDGEPRLFGGMSGPRTYLPWLSRYLGAPNVAINRIFGAKWLISGVARAYRPGCKVDTMLVLEGPQGIKKSSALRVLADAIAPHIFTDEIADVGSKDSAIQLQGMFIVELSELDALRKAEVSTLKAWLSRQFDRFRRPYGRVAEEFPRSSIFAGSVNPPDTGYLKDATGGRRFWPVKCGEIDLPLLTRDAVQLWAEARHLYNEGWEWWLDADEEALAVEVQRSRYEQDPWGQMVERIIAGETMVDPIKLMSDLEIPKERRNPAVLARVAAHLKSIGWQRQQDEEGQIRYKRPDVIV